MIRVCRTHPFSSALKKLSGRSSMPPSPRYSRRPTGSLVTLEILVTAEQSTCADGRAGNGGRVETALVSVCVRWCLCVNVGRDAGHRDGGGEEIVAVCVHAVIFFREAPQDSVVHLHLGTPMCALK